MRKNLNLNCFYSIHWDTVADFIDILKFMIFFALLHIFFDSKKLKNIKFQLLIKMLFKHFIKL